MIYANGLVAIVECLTFRLRKLGAARPAAPCSGLSRLEHGFCDALRGGESVMGASSRCVHGFRARFVFLIDFAENILFIFCLI